MNIFAEVTIDETGIIKQMDAVKEAADRFEDEALKLRGMLAQRQRRNKLLCTIQDFFVAYKHMRTIRSPVGVSRILRNSSILDSSTYEFCKDRRN